MDTATPMARHQTRRVRHETRRRLLTVGSVERLTPHMLRLGFNCADMAGFSSAAHDDHIKLFFPAAGEADARPCMRDYTPRRFDAAAGTLVIDFAIHEAGPATSWALAARIGDMIEIGGPRGSAVVPDDFDWYVLIGDETALPAIGRRLEELRPGVPVTSFIVVPEAGDVQAVETSAAWTAHWVPRSPSRDDATLLLDAMAGYALPPGEGFVWIAAEAGVARALRHHVVGELGHPGAWTRAAGYWRRGQADAHERIGN